MPVVRQGDSTRRGQFRLEFTDARPEKCVREPRVRAWQHKHESKERRTKRRRTKKKLAKEVVVVDDGEDEEVGEQQKAKERVNLPTTLDQALATAFSLNSASPNVAATASTSARTQGPPVASGSTRRLWRNTRAESLSDSGSVEVVITSPTKRLRKHAREQVASNSHTPVTPRVSPRKGKRRQVYTPTISPRKQRRRVAMRSCRSQRLSR